MTARQSAPSTAKGDSVSGRFLSVKEVAQRLGTTERFPRRLIEERRIEFARFGRHIRIAESVLLSYIESNTVAPVSRSRRGRRVA